MFVEHKRAISVNFEGLLEKALLVLQLGVDFKILLALGLFFEIEFVSGSVTGFRGFEVDGLVVDLSADPSASFLVRAVELYFEIGIVLT